MPYTFNENCIDCEKCAERCAAGAVIVLRDGGHIRCEVDQDLCVSCGHCGYICEKSAVIDDKGGLYALRRGMSRIRAGHLKAPRTRRS